MPSEPQSPPDLVLIELQRLRRTVRLILLFCAGLFVIAALFTPVKPRISPHGDSWAAVQAALDRFEYDDAMTMAKRIVAKLPKDHYGYAELGHIALITGDVKAAESYYQRAYELFPGETYTKTLAAIRQRIQKESTAQPAATP